MNIAPIQSENVLVWLDNDYPVTCERCGSRTDFIDLPNGQQKHTCLGCGYVFIGEFTLPDDPIFDDNE